MSIRPSTIIWMVLWVVAAFGLYMVKYKVQAVRTEVASAERQLREEKKNLHVMTAEWTYLNRPERLRQLSAKYLDIKPMHGNQLADFASLPEKNSVTQQASDTQDLPPAHLTLTSGAGHDE